MCEPVMCIVIVQVDMQIFYKAFWSGCCGASASGLTDPASQIFCVEELIAVPKLSHNF